MLTGNRSRTELAEMIARRLGGYGQGVWRPSPWLLIFAVVAIALGAAFTGTWWTVAAMALAMVAAVRRLHAGDRGAPISKDPEAYR